jgi:hypothetical protein
MFSQEPQLGAILQVWEPYGVRHEGIYVGNWRVISASKRTGVVCEESLESFSQGRAIAQEYPSTLSPYAVIAAARAGIGKQWFLFDNCQHYARACHGNRRSPQLEQAAAAAAIALAIGAIFKLSAAA